MRPPSLEDELVDASMEAVAGISAKATEFLAAWQRRNPETPVIFNVFENVIVFETGWQIRLALRRHGRDFEWETQYAPTWRGGHADFALVLPDAKPESAQWWDERLVVEVKWLPRGGDCHSLAGDALKLAWARGRKRYLLAVGFDEDVSRATAKRLRTTCLDAPRPRWKPTDLHRARKNLRRVRVAASRSEGGVATVLFDIQHKTTLGLVRARVSTPR